MTWRWVNDDNILSYCLNTFYLLFVFPFSFESCFLFTFSFRLQSLALSQCWVASRRLIRRPETQKQSRRTRPWGDECKRNCWKTDQMNSTTNKDSNLSVHILICLSHLPYPQVCVKWNGADREGLCEGSRCHSGGMLQICVTTDL